MPLSDMTVMDYIRSLFSLEYVVSHLSRIKPISYIKANAADVLADLMDSREPMVITQNGEAKAVLQDVASFEETQNTLALLKLLALGNRDYESGQTRPARDVVKRLRNAASE